MTLATLQRLARMDPEEIRFRLAGEVRKTVGRVRTRLSPPRWERADLAARLDANAGGGHWTAAVSALAGGDFPRAHEHMGRHFRERSSPFAAGAAGLGELAEAVARDFPDGPADAVARANRILAGRYDLLGYRGLDLGLHPDWHADPVHGRRAPVVFWADVPYLDPGAGDHKIIWELNRHQHWLHLGRAFALSGDRRFYDAFTAQLASWLAANPPLIGTNWASMLELGFRSISWLWALELFAGAASRDDARPWLVDLLLGLDLQLAHVESNLSRYFSPNTHLTGEALALYLAGTALPELAGSAERAAAGRNVLLDEAARQVRPDGGHAELSSHYHRYSTDFYLLAALIARRTGDPAAGALEDAVRAQARYLRAIADDRGIRPQFGDDDGGQTFGMCGRRAADCADTLAAAAVLLGDPALAVGPAPEETYWLCGPDAVRTAHLAHAPWPSTALSATGYYVSRTRRGDHLVFDAGPHGFLSGGHAHSDALSFTLTVAGRPLLIDPGTATYTMDPECRDRFRGTLMHNTVVLDGRPQSEGWGPFGWASAANAHAAVWRSAHGCEYVEGFHDGYAPRRHVRAILAVHDAGWLIVDHITGEGPASLDLFWHLHPAWTCWLEGDRACRLRSGPSRLTLASTVPLALLAPGSDPLAAWSPEYGVIEPAPVVRGSSTCPLPASVATFIAARDAFAESVRLQAGAIAQDPGAGWLGAAFEMEWRGGRLTLLACTQESADAGEAGAAPARRWGTGDLRTDARVAAVFEDEWRGATEILLVDGSVVEPANGPRLISLPAAAPLIRAGVPARPARVGPAPGPVRA